jgi:hypothetical protein
MKMALSEHELDAPVPPDRSAASEMPVGASRGSELLALRNDLAVALLALEALSADPSLGVERRRLAQTGLARQLRAVERLAALGAVAGLARTD